LPLKTDEHKMPLFVTKIQTQKVLTDYSEYHVIHKISNTRGSFQNKRGLLKIINTTHAINSRTYTLLRMNEKRVRYT
jgi:hypothetical protein